MMKSKLEKIIEKWVRAEISSRLAQFVRPNMSKEALSNFRNETWQEMLKQEDEIRKAVFGTDCFVAIAEKLEMFKAADPYEDKKRRRKNRKKNKLKVGRRGKL